MHCLPGSPSIFTSKAAVWCGNAERYTWKHHVLGHLGACNVVANPLCCSSDYLLVSREMQAPGSALGSWQVETKAAATQP